MLDERDLRRKRAFLEASMGDGAEDESTPTAPLSPVRSPAAAPPQQGDAFSVPNICRRAWAETHAAHGGSCVEPLAAALCGTLTTSSDEPHPILTPNPPQPSLSCTRLVLPTAAPPLAAACAPASQSELPSPVAACAPTSQSVLPTCTPAAPPPSASPAATLPARPSSPEFEWVARVREKEANRVPSSQDQANASGGLSCTSSNIDPHPSNTPTLAPEEYARPTCFESPRLDLGELRQSARRAFQCTAGATSSRGGALNARRGPLTRAAHARTAAEAAAEMEAAVVELRLPGRKSAAELERRLRLELAMHESMVQVERQMHVAQRLQADIGSSPVASAVSELRSLDPLLGKHDESIVMLRKQLEAQQREHVARMAQLRGLGVSHEATMDELERCGSDDAAATHGSATGEDVAPIDATRVEQIGCDAAAHTTVPKSNAMVSLKGSREAAEPSSPDTNDEAYDEDSAFASASDITASDGGLDARGPRAVDASCPSPSPENAASCPPSAANAAAPPHSTANAAACPPSAANAAACPAPATSNAVACPPEDTCPPPCTANAADGPFPTSADAAACPTPSPANAAACPPPSTEDAALAMDSPLESSTNEEKSSLAEDGGAYVSEVCSVGCGERGNAVMARRYRPAEEAGSRYAHSLRLLLEGPAEQRDGARFAVEVPVGVGAGSSFMANVAGQAVRVDVPSDFHDTTSDSAQLVIEMEPEPGVWVVDVPGHVKAGQSFHVSLDGEVQLVTVPLDRDGDDDVTGKRRGAYPPSMREARDKSSSRFTMDNGKWGSALPAHGESEGIRYASDEASFDVSSDDDAAWPAASASLGTNPPQQGAEQALLRCACSSTM